MHTINTKSSAKNLVCLIKANKNFKFFIDEVERPPPLVEENSENDKQYILTPEYVWYKIGEYDRETLKMKLKAHYENPTKSPFTSKEELDKAFDILKYRSPTISQLRWVFDLNKCKGCFPQAFWNLTSSESRFEVEDKTGFEYELTNISD